MRVIISLQDENKAAHFKRLNDALVCSNKRITQVHNTSPLAVCHQATHDAKRAIYSSPLTRRYGMSQSVQMVT